MKLAGQVAVIVGGARGIGEAIGNLFSKEGANIVLVDVDKAKSQLDGVTQAINQHGGNAIAFVADASDDAQVNKMVKDSEDFAVEALPRDNPEVPGPDASGYNEAIRQFFELIPRYYNDVDAAWKHLQEFLNSEPGVHSAGVRVIAV